MAYTYVGPKKYDKYYKGHDSSQLVGREIKFYNLVYTITGTFQRLKSK